MKKSEETTVHQAPGVTILPDNQQWLARHASDIARYNAWANTHEPYAQRVRRWRQSQACKPVEADGAV
jgi:hypothetical protein